MTNPKLPSLSDREIYALSHPNSPDFESEMMQKSWYDPKKAPQKNQFEPFDVRRAFPFSDDFFDMHEKFQDELLNRPDDGK